MACPDHISFPTHVFPWFWVERLHYQYTKQIETAISNYHPLSFLSIIYHFIKLICYPTPKMGGSQVKTLKQEKNAVRGKS